MAERRGSRSLRAGGALAALLIAVAVSAPILAPHAPADIDLRARLEPPSATHWLGTDSLGRDVASRLLHGTRVSLSVGVLATLAALALGVPLGAVAGYRGGWVDALVSRGIESVLCFPGLLLALALLAAPPAFVVGLPPVVRIATVIALTGWVPVARFLRGEVLRVRESDVVRAARAAGLRPTRILWRHVLPAALAPIWVTAAFAVAGAITLEAALSFLGLGVPPPLPTWGGMLDEAREHIHRAWWLALFPGAALFVAVLTCNLLGEGLRERLDPRRGPS